MIRYDSVGVCFPYTQLMPMENAFNALLIVFVGHNAKVLLSVLNSRILQYKKALGRKQCNVVLYFKVAIVQSVWV